MSDCTSIHDYPPLPNLPALLPFADATPEPAGPPPELPPLPERLPQFLNQSLVQEAPAMPVVQAPPAQPSQPPCTALRKHHHQLPDELNLHKVVSESDLPGVLSHYGQQLFRSGARLQARCWQDDHEDKSPSVSIIPPGNGYNSWKYKCFGCQASGSALDVVRMFEGLQDRASTTRALEILNRLNGRELVAPTEKAYLPANKVMTREVPFTPQEQREIASAFLDMVTWAAPDSAEKGVEYVMSRGVDRSVIERNGGAYWLEGYGPIKKIIENTNDEMLQRFREAGLVVPTGDHKRERLFTYGTSVICTATSMTGDPAYLWARRMTDEKKRRYLNQPVNNGIYKVPNNLTALHAAVESGQSLRIVEGGYDAMASETLPKEAMLAIGVHGGIGMEKDRTVPPNAQTWQYLVPLLQKCERVQLVPDNDGGKKGIRMYEGACRMADWLKTQAVNSEVATLPELGYLGVNDISQAASRA